MPESIHIFKSIRQTKKYGIAFKYVAIKKNTG